MMLVTLPRRLSCQYIVYILKIILFPGTSGSISMKLSMKHQRFKLIIFCSDDNPMLILTYFTARSNFATSAFIWENVTMMATLEIIASSDLEFGLLCKLQAVVLVWFLLAVLVSEFR